MIRVAQFSDLHYGTKTLAEADRCFGAAIDRAITTTTPPGGLQAVFMGAGALATTTEPADFPLGQACDLSDDGTCEACQ